MKSLSKVLTMLTLSAAAALPAAAEDFAVKTNLLYDATASVNLGFEFGVARQWSVDISGDVNFWNIDGKRWRHWFAQPELRYWLCHRSVGHFLGVHVHGGQYNFGNWGTDAFTFLGTDFGNLKERRYQGWFAGAGIAYGYSWAFSEHWGMEAEIGIGWAYSRYDAYPCRECGRKIKDNAVHNYVGPTKAAINLVYNF
ncbi:MAG: DUF3575 domain-containing protein [Bacteroidales bacterium]|nr:DUF3575 domain-containing protein [Bacteroidales bacterium]MBD5223120.1 DUF3575 domain-containing protein [Bacteroidales bacterium]